LNFVESYTACQKYFCRIAKFCENILSHDRAIVSGRFLARDSMLSALYAIARPSVRLSVRLSVCHTGGSVDNG